MLVLSLSAGSVTAGPVVVIENGDAGVVTNNAGEQTDVLYSGVHLVNPLHSIDKMDYMEVPTKDEVTYLATTSDNKRTYVTYTIKGTNEDLMNLKKCLPREVDRIVSNNTVKELATSQFVTEQPATSNCDASNVEIYKVEIDFKPTGSSNL
jgi:hypothetical protein